MGIPDGAHTHGHGNGGTGTVLLLILAAAVLGPAVTAAALVLLHLLVIIGAVVLGVAAVGLVAAVAWRLRSTRPGPPQLVDKATAVPPWRSQALPTAPPAIGPAREVHLHLHGVTAEDLAVILQRDSAKPFTDQ
jgi:hypothetical protein